VYSEEQIAKQREELEMADTTEKELWVSYVTTAQRNNLLALPQTELLRLSRTNFSESFQILVHLKVLRLFVESVLRYGLPANYVGIVIKVT
jgi:V-type H+-transporting ATPase subunit C